MRRPGAVCLHAALGAAHLAGSLGDVQFLPVTHDESLALTRGQALELLLNDFKNLSLLEIRPWRSEVVRAVGRLESLERILVVVLAAPRREGGEQRRPERAHFL